MGLLLPSTTVVNKKMMFEYALQYAALGWSVLPIKQGTKQPCIKWAQFQKQQANAQDIEKWYALFPEAGIGVVTGRVSSLLVIDVDMHKNAEALIAFQANYPDACETIAQHSGSGNGMHFFYRYPPGININKTISMLIPGIDVFPDGGQILLAPTIHPSGGQYKWGKINPIEDGIDDLMEIPADLLKDILALGSRNGISSSPESHPSFKSSSATDLLELGMGVKEGQRNDACSRLAGHYARENGGDLDRTAAILLRWNQLNRPPLPVDEVLRTAKSICRAEQAKLVVRDKLATSPNDRAIDELNEKFAVITEVDKFTVLQRTWDYNFSREDYVLKSKEAFFSLNANNLVPVEKDQKVEMVNAASLWLRSKKRKEFAQIVFAPGKPRVTDNCFNLWHGLGVEPKPGDWSLMRKHVEDIICSADQDLSKWVFSWMARIVQAPGGERPGTAIALKGMQGTGKTVFVKNFGLLFGRHFLHVGQQGHITGRFNNLLKDKVFVFLDEITWGKNRDGEASSLKFMITEDTIPIEEKFVSSINVKNHINIMLASNSKWAVPAAVDERRFCVIEVSSSRKDDHKYFDQLYHQMDCGGREAMLNDLLKYDWHAVNLKKIPRTNALADQAAFSASAVQQFWDDALHRGYLATTEGSGVHVKRFNIFDGKNQTTELIYQCYLRYCQERGVKDHIEGINNFSKAIAELCPSVERGRNNFKDSNGKWNKSASMRFPTLEQCRAEADTCLKRQTKWMTADKEDKMAA